MRRLSLLALVACAPRTADTLPGDSGSADSDLATPRPVLLPQEARVDADPSTADLDVTLTAAAHTLQVGGVEVAGWAYEGTVPGPMLRAPAGTMLRATVRNELPDPTTVHWHGAGAPYEMDGVPWRRAPIAPGGSFVYAFPLEQPGTFWYHPHIDTSRQVDLGLYGLLVVDDPTDPEVDLDVGLVFDAWAEDGAADHHGLGLDGTELTWTVNGLIDPVLPVAAGSVVRLRLLNASNTGYLDLSQAALQVIGRDQGRLPEPEGGRAVVLAPGDRADVLLSVGSDPRDLMTSPYSLHGGRATGSLTRLLTLLPEGVAPTPGLPDWPARPLAPTPDPGRTDITYTLQGSDQTDGWRINHEVFPDVTIEEVAVGQDVIVEVRNLSPTHHPFHAHGHAFEVLSVDGVAPHQRRVEDTLDLGIHAVARLRFTATRPGDWMVHCHLLPHADGGMMTVLRVVDGATAR